MSERYGKLTLIRVLDERSRGGRVGLWLCDCGVEKAIPFVRVKSGNAKSCGCLKRPHGGVGTPEYVAWGAMRSRCAATKGQDYATYGARGISVCERWESFPAFLEDMGPKPGPEYSVGRRDNDKGYEPTNCHWETPEQQQRNTRMSKVWNIRGKTFESCRAAASHFGVDHRTIRYWVQTKEDCHATSRY